MVIEYCRPSWPGKHSPTPWKAQKTQKRFLTPLFSHLTPLFSHTFVFHLWAVDSTLVIARFISDDRSGKFLFSHFRQSVRYLGPPSSETGTPYRLIGAALFLKVNPKLLPGQAQSIVLSHDSSRNSLRSRGWLVLSWTRTRARR